MKALRTLWGLLVDDGRLASIIVVAVILSAGASLIGHFTRLGAIILWLGLIISLVISVEHQLNVKMKAKKS